MKRQPKAAKKPRFYFAYGSNTNLDQMAHRCPEARLVGAVTLNNYTLHFNGKMSGWGVANVRRSNGRAVQGVLWEITPKCERSLDIYEGYPNLYTKHNITVYAADGTPCKAMVYVMTEAHRAPAIPSRHYYGGIAEGFRQNGISTDSLEAALEETYTKIDRIGGLFYGKHKQTAWG